VKHLPSDERMQSDLEALGIRADGNETDRIRQYCRLLDRWSGRMNLVGPNETGRIWARHVLESACWCRFAGPGAELCDIGSGAGFPGVILAILGRKVTLLEPRRPKYLFLTAVRDELSLPGLAVEKARIEDCAIPVFPLYTARSVGPAARLLGALVRAGACGSLLVARLGPSEEPGPFATETLDLPVPPLDRPGVLVQYRVPTELSTSLRRK